MAKIISLNPEINCLMARTLVDSRKFKKGLFSDSEVEEVAPREGYTVYYQADGVFNKLDVDLSNLKKSLEEKVRIKGALKEKVCIVGFYWIRDKVQITVPIGIPKSDARDVGICKTVAISLNLCDIEEFTASILELDTSSWKVEQRDGFVYEYLMEYYIDSNGEQRGFSIGLRDKIKSKLGKEAISDANADKIIEIAKTIFGDVGVISVN